MLNIKRQRKREFFKTWRMKSVSFSTFPAVKILKCWHRFCGALFIVGQDGVLSTGSSCWGIAVQPWGQTHSGALHWWPYCHTAHSVSVCVCSYLLNHTHSHSSLNAFKDYICNSSKRQTEKARKETRRSLCEGPFSNEKKKNKELV